MSKKFRLRRPIVRQHGKRAETLNSISTATSLPYSLITVKVIELEKVTLSDMQSLKTFVNTLTAHEKYSLLSRDNSMQAI